jgi:hypothetical protein
MTQDCKIFILKPSYSVSFNGKFLPNFNLKYMVSTYTKNFSWKIWPTRKRSTPGFSVGAWNSILVVIWVRLTLCKCTVVAIYVLEPHGFNPESQQHFIPWFNKISWLFQQQQPEEGMKHQMRGWNSGPTIGHDFTEKLCYYFLDWFSLSFLVS